MKTKIIFSFLIGATLLLAGCANENVMTSDSPQTEQKAQSVTTGDQAGADTTDTIAEEKMTEEADNPSLNPGAATVGDSPELDAGLYSVEDMKLYNGAIQLKDDSFCQKITSNDLKEKCVKDIADNKIIAEAVAKMDSSICEQLQGAKVDLCKMEIALASKSEDDFREATAEESEIMRQAEATKDPSLCDQIESERKRENCVTNVETVIRQEAEISAGQY